MNFIEQTLLEHYKKSYNRLVKRTQNRVPNRSIHLAEECVQEAFARAWRYLKAFDSNKDIFEKWFEGILRNVINDCRETETNLGITKEIPEEYPAISVSKEDKAKVTLMMKLIELKSGPHQEVLKLFFVHGFKTREISSYLNMNHSNVRQIIFKFRDSVNEIPYRSG